jgi:hypothetical protein
MIPLEDFIISALYLIRLIAQYKSQPELATYCLEAHKKALNDTIGNFTSPYLSYCMNTAGVGNISISNITSNSRSFDVIIHFVFLSHDILLGLALY